MIENQHKDFTVYCDGDDCGVSEEHSFITFSELINTLKREGWFITKDDDNDTWMHYCPTCAEENEDEFDTDNTQH